MDLQFRDDSSDLQEETGDDAKDGVVKDEDDDEWVCNRGESRAGERAREVASDTEKQDVADDGVEVHEHVLDHDVNVRTLPLDQELVVDSGKDRTKDLIFKNWIHGMSKGEEESKTGDNDDYDNDDSVVELETCVKMNISPSPIAAQEVAAKPFVDPWPSLAVPPAWIIHLGRMNIFLKLFF